MGKIIGHHQPAEGRSRGRNHAEEEKGSSRLFVRADTARKKETHDTEARTREGLCLAARSWRKGADGGGSNGEKNPRTGGGAERWASVSVL